MKRLLFMGLILAPCVALAMRFVPAQIITNAAMTGNVSSIGLDINQLYLGSIQATYTGSPTGTIKVQVSDDIVAVAPGADPSANVVHWDDYTGSSTAVAGAGSITYNLSFTGYRWVRLVYTFTSGTGTLNATFSGKGPG